MNAQIVSFRCTLRSRTGQFISSSVSRDVLTSAPGAEELPLQGLARGLKDLKKGELRHIQIPAQDAYGFYDPEKVMLVPRKLFPRGTKLIPNESVTLISKAGEPRNFRVVQLFKALVQLDGNHPLAGQDLDFEIEALDVRDATPDEIHEATETPVRTDLH